MKNRTDEENVLCARNAMKIVTISTIDRCLKFYIVTLCDDRIGLLLSLLLVSYVLRPARRGCD